MTGFRGEFRNGSWQSPQHRICFFVFKLVAPHGGAEWGDKYRNERTQLSLFSSHSDYVVCAPFIVFELCVFGLGLAWAACSLFRTRLRSERLVGQAHRIEGGMRWASYSYSIEERYPLMRWTNQTGSRVMGIDVKRIARERSVLSAADPCRRKRSRCRWHFSARDALPLIRRSKPKRPRTTAGSKRKVEVPNRVGVDKPTLLRMMVPFSLSINPLRLLSRGSSYAGVCVIDMLGGPRCRRGGAGGSLVVFYLRLS